MMQGMDDNAAEQQAYSQVMASLNKQYQLDCFQVYQEAAGQEPEPESDDMEVRLRTGLFVDSEVLVAADLTVYAAELEVRPHEVRPHATSEPCETLLATTHGLPSFASDTSESIVNYKQQLPAKVEAINSDDKHNVAQAIVWFRKLLSIDCNPAIDHVVNSGVLPRMILMLTDKSNPQAQFEAAWALTNITCGTSAHTQILIDNNAVPAFIQLLVSTSEDIREQAVWALGNIAGDSSRCRDLVLNFGIVGPIMAQINEKSRPSMLRTVAWALSNLCRGKPPPNFEVVKPLILGFAQLIFSQDDECVADVCWALSYVSNNTTENIQAILDAGIAVQLIDLLVHPDPSIQTPALRTVGNIMTGDDNQTQAMIDAGVLPRFHDMLEQHNKTGIRKDACWTMSNITAGNKDQVHAVLAAGLLPSLVDALADVDFGVKTEAAWAISNATKGRVPKHIKYIVDTGIMKSLCDLLDVQDATLLTIVLEAVENVLRVGHAALATMGLDENPYAIVVNEAGFLVKLEVLRAHENTEVKQRAKRILQNYTYSDKKDTQGDTNNVRMLAWSYSLSSWQARGAVADWLERQAAHGRSRVVVAELLSLEEKLYKWSQDDRKEWIRAFWQLVQHLRWGIGAYWAPHYDADPTTARILFAINLCANGPLHLSEANMRLGAHRVCLPVRVAISPTIHQLLGHRSPVNSASFSPDGEKVVSASGDKTVRIWSAVTGECEQTLAGHRDRVMSASFSLDGEKVVSASLDYIVRIWSAVTGECEQTLAGHTSNVNSASISHDGEKVVSASVDKTVRIWSAVTGECEQTLAGHTSYVNSASFSPDGEKVVSASEDGTVRIWSAVIGECEQTVAGGIMLADSVGIHAWLP